MGRWSAPTLPLALLEPGKIHADLELKKAPGPGAFIRRNSQALLEGRSVAALQSWAVIVICLAGTVVVRIISRCAAQGWTVLVFLVILHLVAVLYRSQSRLHLVEFRGAHHVLIAWGQNRLHLLLCMFDPVRC